MTNAKAFQIVLNLAHVAIANGFLIQGYRSEEQHEAIEYMETFGDFTDFFGQDDQSTS